MAEIILYSNKLSWGRATYWLLETLALAYQVVGLDFDPLIKKAEYLAINPMGKVPALKHGETVVTETATILTYMVETFSDKGLIPATDSPESAAFTAGCFLLPVHWKLRPQLGFLAGKRQRKRPAKFRSDTF